MPVRNTMRIDTSDSYYHVYSRGRDKAPIFSTPDDYAKFLEIIARYLSVESKTGKDGIPYPHLRDQLELNAYCLMGNHFHLLIYQHKRGGISLLMKSVLASYTSYFNRKYSHSGSLFESRYKAARIDNDSYLSHISRYVHLNPRSWKLYQYSSIAYYRGRSASPEWLMTERVLGQFGGRADYYSFLCDYEGYRDMLAEIKYDLADK